MKLVITGGHHSSALPIIDKIRKQGLDIDIYWIGHRHSLKGDKNDTLEYKEITQLGIPFYELKAGKVYRALTFTNLKRLPLSFYSAYKYLADIKPDLILSFGGYLAVPVVLAGWLLNIPSITHEQTSVVGYANRVISFFAKEILISWKESAKFFNPKKVVYTGLPLRDSIYDTKSNEFTINNNLPTVYITAGKSGSTRINDIINTALPKLLVFCNVIHQCGDYSLYDDFDKLNQTYNLIKDQSVGLYFVRKFIYENEIGEAYSKSALIIARAGAHTVSEILALEKPALLIPLLWVSHNEQVNNAMIIKNHGLGEVLNENDLTPDVLVERVRYMLHNISSYKPTFAGDFKELSKNAAAIILNEILKYEKNKT